jgi:hypothetical protein
MANFESSGSRYTEAKIIRTVPEHYYPSIGRALTGHQVETMAKEFADCVERYAHQPGAELGVDTTPDYDWPDDYTERDFDAKRPQYPWKQ